MAASAKPNIFLRRPILSSVISIVITLVGALAMKALPIAQYPELVPPTVNVTVFYPGASAETIAGTVLAPLEVNINGVENMLYMTSTASSGSGSGSINVYFSLGTDPDMALVNVNNKVNLAQTTLPETVRLQGVQVTKRSPAMLQIIALFSPDGRYDAVYLHNYMQVNVADELKRVPGVGDVTVLGYMDYAMRIWLVPDKLAKYGVTVSEIAAAIQEQNSQFSPGRLGDAPMPETAQLSWQIDTKGRLATPQEFGEIIIRTGEDSAMLRLKDVARIEMGGKDYSVSSEYNGMVARAMGIYLLPGANAIATGEAVTARMQELAKNFPEGIDYKIIVDTNDFVMESINEVVHTLVEAMILVFLVHRRARVHHRYLRGHVRPGLHHQYPDPVRYGAGHRYRGGRRHRGAGERGTYHEHRAPAAQGSHGQGHERSDGSRYRHRAGALRRVHPRVLHGRPGGPDVQAVRHHHLGIGGALRHRGPDAHPVALLAAAQAACA